MDKLIWRFKMLIGLICFEIYMRIPAQYLNLTPAMWLLSWAGFYAFDDGYKNQKERQGQQQ